MNSRLKHKMGVRAAAMDLEHLGHKQSYVSNAKQLKPGEFLVEPQTKVDPTNKHMPCDIILKMADGLQVNIKIHAVAPHRKPHTSLWRASGYAVEAAHALSPKTIYWQCVLTTERETGLAYTFPAAHRICMAKGKRGCTSIISPLAALHDGRLLNQIALGGGFI